MLGNESNDNTMRRTNLSIVGGMTLQKTNQNLQKTQQNIRDEIEFYNKRNKELEDKEMEKENEKIREDEQEYKHYKKNYFYDSLDNDINRQANKNYNTASHIVFNGTGVPNNSEDKEKLRKRQQQQALKKALADQIEAKRLREKNEEKERKEKERARVVAHQKRIEMENKAKELQAIEKAKLEKEVISSNNMTKTVKFDTTVKEQTMEKENMSTLNVSQNIPKQTVIEQPQLIEQPLPLQQQLTPKKSHFHNKQDWNIEEEKMPTLSHYHKRDIFDDKYYILDLERKIRNHITEEITDKMNRFHSNVLQENQKLKDQLTAYQSEILKVSQNKSKIERDIEQLRKQILQDQYKDEVRTDELIKAMEGEGNHRILPSDTFYRDSGGMIKDVKRIDDDYIEQMDYLANYGRDRPLIDERRFVPLADYEDLYEEKGYKEDDRFYNDLLDYQSKLISTYRV